MLTKTCFKHGFFTRPRITGLIPLLPATTNQQSHIHIKCQKTILTSVKSTFWLNLNLNHKRLEIKTLRLGVMRKRKREKKKRGTTNFYCRLRLCSSLMRPRSPGTQASAPPLLSTHLWSNLGSINHQTMMVAIGFQEKTVVTSSEPPQHAPLAGITDQRRRICPS